MSSRLIGNHASHGVSTLRCPTATFPYYHRIPQHAFDKIIGDSKADRQQRQANRKRFAQ